MATKQARPDPLWVRAIRKICNAGGVIAGTTTVIMGLQIVVDVVARGIFNHPVPGTLEIVQYWWMPVIGFLSLGIAQLLNQQIRVTVAIEGARPTTAKVLEIVSEVICGVVGAWMVYLLADRALTSFTRQEAGIVTEWIPLWPGRAVLVVGMALLVLAVLVRLRVLLRVKGIEFDELGEVKEIV